MAISWALRLSSLLQFAQGGSFGALDLNASNIQFPAETHSSAYGTPIYFVHHALVSVVYPHESFSRLYLLPWASPSPSKTYRKSSPRDHKNMKLILTGATGFIGGEVLRQCLQNPSITLITVITRRPLPDEFGSPKLRVLLCKDDFEWLEWGPKMMRWVDGSDACIWFVSPPPTVRRADITGVWVPLPLPPPQNPT